MVEEETNGPLPNSAGCPEAGSAEGLLSAVPFKFVTTSWDLGEIP
jgi:hypothetical protein